MASFLDKLPPARALPIMLGLLPRLYWHQQRKNYREVLKIGREMLGSAALKTIGFRNYAPSGRDVFVCTYSKSGTYWMLQLATQIASRGAAEFEHIHDLVPWPEVPLPGIVQIGVPTWERSRMGMRAIKTHAEAEFIPYDAQAKYVVVIRDPKDALISGYFFLDSISPGVAEVGLDAWTEDFIAGEVPYGWWPDHVAGFWPWRTRENVLVTTYAEMKRDLVGVVGRVAELMEVELDAGELAQVVERGGFAHMKAHQHKFRPHVPSTHPERVELIRKGQTGESGQLLSSAQRARVDEAMKRGLRELGCDFPYDETFGETRARAD